LGDFSGGWVNFSRENVQENVEKFPFQMMHQPITYCVTTLHG